MGLLTSYTKKDYSLGRCECCDEPAATVVVDLREVTKRGDKWRTWASEKEHRFCKRHTRKPYRYSDNPPISAEPVKLPEYEDDVCVKCHHAVRRNRAINGKWVHLEFNFHDRHEPVVNSDPSTWNSGYIKAMLSELPTHTDDTSSQESPTAPQSSMEGKR